MHYNCLWRNDNGAILIILSKIFEVVVITSSLRFARIIHHCIIQHYLCIVLRILCVLQGILTARLHFYPIN